MKKVIFPILFILYISNIYSQESTNFLFQFYGYEGDPIKLSYLKSLSLEEINDSILVEFDIFYEAHKDEISWNSDLRIIESRLSALAAEAKADQEKTAAVMEAITQGISAIQQQNAERKQQKAAQEAKWRAEQQARVAQNKQKYEEFQAMTNNRVNSSYHQSNSSSYRTQSSYNDLLTSDPDWNKQVQMSAQQYGVEQTREMINNQRTQQRQQEATTGGFRGHVISAVTANRQAIKIQVRDRQIGGRVVAYSLGGNAVGEQQWRTTDGVISKCTSNMEFQYTAHIQGVGNVYFDL